MAAKFDIKKDIFNLSIADRNNFKYCFINSFNKKWHQMFLFSDREVRCNVCAKTFEPGNFRQHFLGRKHQKPFEMNKVEIHHPKVMPNPKYKEDDSTAKTTAKTTPITQPAEKPKADKPQQQSNLKQIPKLLLNPLSIQTLKETVSDPIALDTNKTKVLVADMKIMTLPEIKRIKFSRLDGKKVWEVMLDDKANTGYHKCMLCKTGPMDKIHAIRSHIGGKTHISNLNNVNLFHPKYVSTANDTATNTTTPAKQTTVAVVANAKIQETIKPSEIKKTQPEQNKSADKNTSVSTEKSEKSIVKAAEPNKQTTANQAKTQTIHKIVTEKDNVNVKNDKPPQVQPKAVNVEKPTPSIAPKATTPAKPAAPAKVTTPAKTPIPAKPEIPAKAQVPAKPTTSKKPQTLTQALMSSKALTPAKTATPTNTATPAKALTPAKTATPTNTATSAKAPTALNSKPSGTFAKPNQVSNNKNTGNKTTSNKATPTKDAPKTVVPTKNVLAPTPASAKANEDKNSSAPDCTAVSSSSVQTITIEDSPERTIRPPAKKDNTLVVNPAALRSRAIAAKDSAKPPQATLPSKTQQSSAASTSIQPSKPAQTPTSNQSANASKTNTSLAKNQPPGSNISPKNKLPSFLKRGNQVQPTDEVEGFVGVEYVIKTVMYFGNNASPRYECALCEVESDGQRMENHLKSLGHRLKFMDKHFPTCMRQFQKYRDDPTALGLLSKITQKLAIAIEKHHGREQPYECLQNEYRSNRYGIMAKAFSFRHASEYCGPSFTNIISKKVLDDIAASCNLNIEEYEQQAEKRKITFDSQIQQAAKQPRIEAKTLDNEEHKRLVDQFLKKTCDTGRPMQHSPSRRGHTHHSRDTRPPFRRDKYDIPPRKRRSRSRSRPSRSLTQREPASHQDSWKSFHRAFDDACHNLKKAFKDYSKNPDTHPNYNEEWRDFWNNRCDELVTEGKDPTQTDLTPEWVTFWTHRMKEILEEDIERLKVKLRVRFDLPISDTSEDENDDQRTKPIEARKVDLSDISADESEQPSTAPAPPSFKPDSERLFRNPSPVQNVEEEIFIMNRELENPPKERTATNMDIDDDDKFDSDKLTIISVLRLLVAMEENLGSFGPKVIELLAKAIPYEKVRPGFADESLLTHDNCVLLETLREKLRGQLIAGVLAEAKVNVVKKAIKDITTLLNLKIKRRNQMEAEKEIPMKSNITNPAFNIPSSIQTTEKRQLAVKLANALAAQGKTDFTAEQLEQLVAIYSVIEKKQRESTANQQSQQQQSNKTKSLSETLIDFLKPSGAPATDGPIGSSSSRPNLSSSSSAASTSKSTSYWRSESQVQTSSNSDQRTLSSRSIGSAKNSSAANRPVFQTGSSVTAKKPQYPTPIATAAALFQLSQFNTSLKLDQLNSPNLKSKQSHSAMQSRPSSTQTNRIDVTSQSTIPSASRSSNQSLNNYQQKNTSNEMSSMGSYGNSMMSMNSTTSMGSGLMNMNNRSLANPSNSMNHEIIRNYPNSNPTNPYNMNAQMQNTGGSNQYDMSRNLLQMQAMTNANNSFSGNQYQNSANQSNNNSSSEMITYPNIWDNQNRNMPQQRHQQQNMNSNTQSNSLPNSIWQYSNQQRYGRY